MGLPLSCPRAPMRDGAWFPGSISRARARARLRELNASLELRDESRIVLEQQPNVRNVVTKHQHALHAHSEGEAGVSLGIDATVREHIRVNHSAAENLQPTGGFAHAAAGSSA